MRSEACCWESDKSGAKVPGLAKNFAPRPKHIKTDTHALDAQPSMKIGGLGRRPARAVKAIFRLDAHAAGRTTVDENPAGTVGDRPERYGRLFSSQPAEQIARFAKSVVRRVQVCQHLNAIRPLG